jgi:4a-hydroxytetrahydrobiopterin dehydratase
MNELKEQRCRPCEGGVEPLTVDECAMMLKQLHADWKLGADSKSIKREFVFKNFYRTMSYVNAIAHVANTEDHHPDLAVGYNYCHVTFSTHAIKGLSNNDFICAAKIDGLAVQ